MIELHGHEGYLMDQFKTALWNKRTDKYGGSLENRLRFSTEIIQAIKDKAGTDFPIIYRFGLTHFYEGGRTIDEGLEIAKLLEKAGADALDIDAGCYETWYHPHPPTTMPAGLHTELAARVKQEVSIPVIAVSKLGNPLLAEQVLQQGMADFIALGRPLLADPEWLVKVKDCKPEDIRPCVGCHEGCLARIYAGKYNSCTVNPATGMERDFVITKAEKSKQVLIIGGGPAGMEAARVSALRGHKVMLWEKDDCLGGNFRIKSVPAFKDEYAQFTRYQEQQLKKLSVSVILNRTAVAEDIIKENPDVVYIATGAAYKTPDLPGKELQHVLKPLQALSGLIPSAHQVVIIGGNLAGAEVALYLAQTGCRVILVEMTDTIACDCFIANRMHLMVLLEETGVKLMTSTEAKAITETEVIVSYNNKDLHLQADRVVMATGAAADRELYNQLEGKIMELYNIGDCIKPGKLINAIWDAYRTARLV